MRKFAGIAIVMILFALNVQAKEWETDFAEASALAKKSGKYMLLDFSGSDWCGWCIRLEREAFSKDEFKTYAKDNLVCVMLDFPRKNTQSQELKKQNAELARKYKIRGYPTIIVLSPDGEIAGKTGYQKGGPVAYVKHLTAIIDKHKVKKETKN